MTITNRAVQVSSDLSEMLELADVSGLNSPHVADWPYRFASWGMQDPQNARVWLNSASQIVGWAVMQTPFWAVDCVAAPDVPAKFYAEMLAWAQARAATMSGMGTGRPMWFLSIAANCERERRALAAAGFEDISDVGENSWSKVLLELVDARKLEPIRLPAGLRIRSLDAQTELQKYVDLHRDVFESESMTYAWRAQSTEMAAYHNPLDLVIADAQGDLKGFCVAWLRRLANGEVAGQIEPMGIRKDHRGKGLSRQLMTEAIRRLRQLGAERIFVETDKQRIEAMAAYKATGFEPCVDVVVYKHTV